MPKSDSVVIDPVKMNIINKISAGSNTSGNLSFNGGLLLQGHHVGELTVSGGPLVILEDASVSGKVTVQGDVWVFGRIGSTEPDAVPTHMTVHGVSTAGDGGHLCGFDCMRDRCQLQDARGS